MEVAASLLGSPFVPRTQGSGLLLLAQGLVGVLPTQVSCVPHPEDTLPACMNQTCWSLCWCCVAFLSMLRSAFIYVTSRNTSCSPQVLSVQIYLRKELIFTAHSSQFGFTVTPSSSDWVFFIGNPERKTLYISASFYIWSLQISSSVTIICIFLHCSPKSWVCRHPCTSWTSYLRLRL